jgi:hypothetical protein
VALAMLAFTAPDIREVAHQMHQARPGLAALAATVAVLHLLAAVGDLVVRFERDLALDGVLSRKTRQMVEKFVADLEARGPGYLADLARQAFIQYRGAT